MSDPQKIRLATNEEVDSPKKKFLQILRHCILGEYIPVWCAWYATLNKKKETCFENNPLKF